MSILESIKEAVVKGSAPEVKKCCEEAVAEGLDASMILNEGLIAGLNVVGVKFRNNEVFVPEVLMCARSMHSGLAVLKPIIASSGIKEKGVFVIGTVKGDLHDIGKNMVTMMMEGSGYKVVDLGMDVSIEKFIEAAELHKPDIIGLSALLTTTMAQMKKTVAAIKEYNPDIKILVGGAPVDDKFAREIGADGCAEDATSAVDKANELISA